MKKIETTSAPAAIGPYSQAIVANGFVFCSGQIALMPDGNLVDGGIDKQTLQVMENLSGVLKEAGSGLDNVVKTTIYLANMSDFAVVNKIYGDYFGGSHKPARATVEVSSLPEEVLVEIECVAVL